MKRERLHHRLVSLLGLAMFLVTVYLGVVVLCLVRIGSASPARPDGDSSAWTVLSAISPVSHCQRTARWSGAMEENVEGYLRAKCNIWPWEQLSVRQEDMILTVDVLATTEARARRIAREVQEHICRSGGRVTSGSGHPPRRPGG